MNEYGKVLFIDSVDNQNVEQKEAFSCHMFCQYSGTVYEKLSQEDKSACEEIISTVGFHALAVKLIALLNIMVRQSRQSGVTRATCPD